MNLLNQMVEHARFGEGRITAQSDNHITVTFAAKESIFSFPDAFDSFLKCKDADLQTKIEAAIVAKKEADAIKTQEERESRLRVAEEFRKQNTAPSSYERHADENNLAFKCNYCDGGCSNNCLGFKNVCSDEQIRYNIEKKKRAWCSNPDSACFQYLNGSITRDELEASNRNGNFVCYEANMLTEWKAQAGDDVDKNGDHKARRITNASQDSLAVLTTELPDNKDRIIFGVFITGMVDEGDEFQSGYVKAKADYFIELTPEEAGQMKFWRYYKNPNSDKTQWGTGLYRYLKDTTAARILADIVEIKAGAEKVHAQKVLKHYCELKEIDIHNIPAASGAIK